MDLAQTTVIGNLTRDPDLRFTANGRPVANIGIAVNSRYFDRTAGEYRDGKTTFIDASVWGEAAENLAASMQRGDRIVAVGRLDLNEWEGRDGQRQSRLVMQADEVGPSLRFVTTASTRTERGGRQQAGGGSTGGNWADQYAAGNVQQSPEEMRRNWAAQQPQQAQQTQQAPVQEQWGRNPATGPDQGDLGVWGQQDPWAGSQPQNDKPPF